MSQRLKGNVVIVVDDVSAAILEQGSDYCAHYITPPVSDFTVSQLRQQRSANAQGLVRARFFCPIKDQIKLLLLVYESISARSNTNVVHGNTNKLFYPLHIEAGSLGKFIVTSNRRNVTLPPRQNLIVDLKHKARHIRDEIYAFLVSYTCLNCHY